MLSSVGKNALLLGTAAVLCVFAVAAVNEITKTEIEQQQLASKLSTLVEVVPELAGNTDSTEGLCSGAGYPVIG